MGSIQATEIIRQQQGPEQLLVTTAQLEVISGPDKGLVVELAEKPIAVGSDRDCDLVLTDSTVSHQQFTVEAGPQGYLLRDSCSTNGTFIGAMRVREVFLSSPSTITAGRTEIRFSQLKDQQKFDLSRRHRFGSLHGRAPAMRRCFALLEAAANSDATLLLEGDSGTGKELAATSVHQLGRRAEHPFVVVDCGSIPANLMESELFGHIKGAYTGASSDRLGLLEQANNGTLFLDEIGELDIALQPKLLRFLESRQVQRLGSANRRKVDVRVIAASNRKLENRVAQGHFREDLFYRLAVLKVRLPSLRERTQDIPLLALELARQLLPDRDPLAWLDDNTLTVLQSHHWPGNVRELRNVIERLAALPQEALDLGLPGQPAASQSAEQMGTALTTLPYHSAKQQVLDRFEKSYLQEILQQENNVVARAAQRAGVPRQTLFRLIRKHNLREP